MSRKTLPLFRLLMRRLSNERPKVKFDVALESDVEEGLQAGSLKTRKHPGVFAVNTVSLPEQLTQAATLLLKDYPIKNLERDAKTLSSYIWSRHPPLESIEYKEKMAQVRQRLIERGSIDPRSPWLSEEESKRLQDSLRSKLEYVMKKETYHWKAIQYDQYMCAVYLAARMAPDFAALVRILTEVRRRDQGFRPLTVLDYGSGLGTSMWAIDRVWPDTCREVVCVDSSADMNNMADRLLRGGESNNPRLVREGGTFFKQFLPMSDALKYNVVLSSRSLLELPDMTSRLKTIDILWRKTSGYLIIVEAGTNVGYNIVQEARDYVLELSRRAQEEGDSNPEGYVFSPCAHDKLCPRFLDGSNIPCNFEVPYRPFSLEREKGSKKDSFSYVVIKRGRRNESAEKPWPRLIQAPLARKKHVICRTCTQHGTLSEMIVTKRKHSKECYRVCKHSQWGDLLPVDQPQEHLTQDPGSGHLHANDQAPDEAAEVV